MRKIIITIILLHCIFLSFSQEAIFSNYEIKDIPENLKKDASAVYRLDEGILQITSPSKYTLQVHQVTTILNADGAEHLPQSLRFDKFNKVDYIEVKLYNSSGIETQKYKKKDFSVQSYYDGMSLATDDKTMRLSLSATEYPFTIDVKYNLDVSGYIDLPDWYMNNSASSIEQFRYIVKVPAGLDIRYRSLNMALDPVITEDGKQKMYTWETKNVAVNKIESGGYEANTYSPRIEVSPTEFEYDGYKGDFKNWKNFGKWCYDLYEEKNSFPQQRILEIKSMVNGLQDVNSKVKVLYDYLKKNTRYVSIQFGIGGYKPFPVKFVDEKKYGDCKALTNYMRSLLAVVGIKSYPALINAGFNKAPVNPAFPENIFNHVILCVPGAKDSIWLECTSTNNDAGFLGSFTENKNALLLTEDGGIIVPTPKSNYNNNVLTTVNNIFLNEEGGAEVNSVLSSSGSFYSLIDEVSKMESTKQSELFVEYLDYKEPDEFHLNRESGMTEKHQLKLKMIYTKLFDFKAGNKFFFPKSINKLCDEKMKIEDDRKTEYIFNFPYIKIDTTIFHLPAAFKVDKLLQDKELTDGPVFYTREVSFDKTSNTIKIASVVMLKNNIVPPDQYKNVSEIFNKIEKEESNKLILQKEVH